MPLSEQFKQIVDEHYEMVWSYVGYLTGGSDEGEDIVHEAFLMGFDRLAAGEEFSGDPGKWLRGVVRNLVYAWWRQKRRMPRQLADRLKLLADEAEDAATAAARDEMQAALDECLAKLAADERKLIQERYTAGRHIKRVAESIGVTATSLRVKLFRLRRKLKLCVESHLHEEGGSL